MSKKTALSFVLLFEVICVFVGQGNLYIYKIKNLETFTLFPAYSPYTVRIKNE